MDKENLKKITALLVHVAKVDENYSEKEKSIIKNFIVSFSYNDKDSENSPIVSALKNYVHAAGTAIFWNTVVSNTYNQKTFCPPSNWSPSLNDFINYIDFEIMYAKINGKYKDSDKVAFYMSTYLYKVFPCK